jgi:hypothetical protein
VDAPRYPEWFFTDKVGVYNVVSVARSDRLELTTDEGDERLVIVQRVMRTKKRQTRPPTP